MATAAIVILFLLMLAAPCVLALRSAEQGDEPDEIAIAEMVVATAKPLPLTMPIVASVKPPTLEEMAAEAELDALVARDLARDAHWAALAAQARAARLRADFKAEAELVAEMAYFDLPRVRTRGRAA